MSEQDILATKLFMPPLRPVRVLRANLIGRLNEGLYRKLTLISAPAGFGKTTLVSEWVDALQTYDYEGREVENRIGWLSIDEGDNDPVRFLAYLVTAIRQVEGIDATFGKGALSMFQSPRPPPMGTILTSLINKLAVIPLRIVLVLDDYHRIDSHAIHEVVGFLLENNPPQLHMVLVTREDPPLPLSRLRTRGQLTELRAADLRFTSAEAAEFLNRVMDLNLSAEEIALLETRTEGWIAGLQLAAISLQGGQDTQGFIQSFSGSHRLVLDYLMHEVLGRQPDAIQRFLLQTAILDRLTGSLCDALTGREDGQTILEKLERANLFLVPLDEERRWYRYHHLFAGLMRKRLRQDTTKFFGDEMVGTTELHRRAMLWYEDNGLELEAFHHAVAAGDTENAARLVEGDEMPLHLRGGLVPVLKWLDSLPATIFETRPVLWVIYASALLYAGRLSGVEEKLQAAEAALEGAELNDRMNFLVGLTASTRAALSAITVAGQPSGVEQKLQNAEAVLQDTEEEEKSQGLVDMVSPRRAIFAIEQDQVETVIFQARRALAHLHPHQLDIRLSMTWLLGVSYQLRGDLTAAGQMYSEAITMGRTLGKPLITIPATIGLGNVQEAQNQLFLAAETYRRGLKLAGDQPLPVAAEACLGLARIHYEWNDLESAQHHWKQSTELARKLDITAQIVSCDVFLARLRLAQGQAAEAAEILAHAEHFVRQHDLGRQTPEVAAAQVLTALRRGHLATAVLLVQQHNLPLNRARVHLAQGDPDAALEVLAALRREVEARDWADERLKALVLQSVALQALGDQAAALELLGEAVTLAEPGGFVRIFLDEGVPVARLLDKVQARGMAPDYIHRILAASPAPESQDSDLTSSQAANLELIEPLSDRELEVLELIAAGLTNREVASRLYLSLHTIKVHNRNIYGKLGVKNRTEAAAKGRTLGILPPA